MKRKIQTNSRNGRISPFPPLNMWQEARKYPKILGSGEEREREQGLRGKLWEIGHGRFSFPRGLLEPVSGYRSVEAR